MANASHLPDLPTSPPEASTDRSPDAGTGPRTDAGESLDENEPTGTAVLEQAIRVATGLAALGIASAADAIRRTMPAPPPTDEPAPERTDPLGLATGAFLGLTLIAGDRIASAVGGVSRAVGPPASWIAGVPPLGPAVAWVRSTAASLDERWRASRPDAEVAATAFARELVPEVIDAVLDQLDLTWLVAERVDLDDIVARVDLDRAVARVDLDRIVSRVDLDEVASRIDVDAIAQRLDVEAIVDHLDLAGLARTVIEEIDLPEIIRQSTGSVASETVREVRMQGIQADRSVSRVVDRVLFRDRVRDTGGPREPQAADDAAPDGSDDHGPGA